MRIAISSVGVWAKRETCHECVSGRSGARGEAPLGGYL